MVTKGTAKALTLQMKAWFRRKLFARKLQMTDPEFANYEDSFGEQRARNDRLNNFVLQLLEYRFGKLDTLTAVRIRFLAKDLLFALGHDWATFKSKSSLKHWLIEHAVKPEK